MAARPDLSAFNDALPILGRDGTLARTVSPDSPARGHAHAKTGTYWVDNELTGQGRAHQQGPGRLPRDRLGPSARSLPSSSTT